MTMDNGVEDPNYANQNEDEEFLRQLARAEYPGPEKPLVMPPELLGA